MRGGGGQWPKLQVFLFSSIPASCTKPFVSHRGGGPGPAESEPASIVRLGAPTLEGLQAAHGVRGAHGAGLQLGLIRRPHLPSASPDGVVLEEEKPAARIHVEGHEAKGVRDDGMSSSRILRITDVRINVGDSARKSDSALSAGFLFLETLGSWGLSPCGLSPRPFFSCARARLRGPSPLSCPFLPTWSWTHTVVQVPMSCAVETGPLEK